MTYKLNQQHSEDDRQPQQNNSNLNSTLQRDQAAAVLKRKSSDESDQNDPQNNSTVENNSETPTGVKKTKKSENSKDKNDSNNKNSNNAPKLQCEFFLKKKNRRCRMMRKASQKYCAEHLVIEQQETSDEKNNNNDDQETSKSNNNLAAKRIPCPVDPSHSVWEKNLKEHINRCNRAKSQRLPESQPWFIRDLNDCSKLEKNTENTRDDNMNGEQPQQQQQPKAEIDYAYWVPIIEKAYKNLISIHLPQSSLLQSSTELKLDRKTLKENNSINDRLSQLTNQKHIIQQSSLIGHLDNQGLYGPQFNYIEFGCGRAELSRYLSKAIVYETLNKSAQVAHDNNINNGANVEMPGFLLIDRSPVRMKMDTKIGKDYAEVKQFFDKKSNNGDDNGEREQATDDSNSRINGDKKVTNADNGEPPYVHRVKIDIKDLNLDYCLQLSGFNKSKPQNLPRKFVGISKHLCGCATDLTLQCILNSKVLTTGSQSNQNETTCNRNNKPTFDRFGGLIVAMCCRHVCNYPQFLPIAKQFLASVFEIVTPSKNSIQDEENKRDFDEEKLKAIFTVITKMVSWATCGRREGMQDNDINNHGSGLTVLQREQLGLKARRLIDESRLAAIRAAGLNAEICHYVEKEISLENVCLIVTPKK